MLLIYITDIMTDMRRCRLRSRDIDGDAQIIPRMGLPGKFKVRADVFASRPAVATMPR